MRCLNCDVSQLSRFSAIILGVNLAPKFDHDQVSALRDAFRTSGQY
jgi:hypothetical protein